MFTTLSYNLCPNIACYWYTCFLRVWRIQRLTKSRGPRFEIGLKGGPRGFRLVPSQEYWPIFLGPTVQLYVVYQLILRNRGSLFDPNYYSGVPGPLDGNRGPWTPRVSDPEYYVDLIIIVGWAPKGVLKILLSNCIHVLRGSVNELLLCVHYKVSNFNTVFSKKNN